MDKTVGRHKLKIVEVQGNTCDGCLFEASNIKRNKLRISCYTAKLNDCNSYSNGNKPFIYKEL